MKPNRTFIAASVLAVALNAADPIIAAEPKRDDVKILRALKLPPVSKKTGCLKASRSWPGGRHRAPRRWPISNATRTPGSTSTWQIPMPDLYNNYC